MSPTDVPPPVLVPTSDLADVQARLDEAEETLRAIRHGEVDALVVQNETPAAQVFTLSSADRPYRRFVESMRDGAATVSESGIVLYANRRLAGLLALPLRQLIGSPITSFVAATDRVALRGISGRHGGTIEVRLIDSNQREIPVRISTSKLDVDAHDLLCITITDLTEQNAQKLEIDRLGQAQAERMRELELAKTTLTEQAAQLTVQATHDSLTGLPNRHLLIDRLSQSLALAQRSKSSTGLIFVDLDHFKQINDTLGHDAGDSVLRQISERLLGSVRPMDSVSRLGGDEFVVLLPQLGSPKDVIAVASRIAAHIEAPLELPDGPIAVTASIGIARSDQTPLAQHRNPDQLLQQADTAMYHAKSLGGSQFQVFDAKRTPSILLADRTFWVSRIHEALEEDRFVLHAQPIIELATGAVVQQELLLRLRDRDGSLVPPLAFLPTAERCGLIGEIDQWVIKQGAELAARGRLTAVNLSAASAGNPVVLELIEHELDRHGTDPGNLVFEITETAVMQNIDRGRRFAEHLVALGCQIALDDFGTGFASFIYLKRLPVRYLKIDIEFVRGLVHSRQDRSVVSAIVSLADGFGQHTIAEGVEDEETADLLRDLGVTYAQGYLFGRPAPIAALNLCAGPAKAP
jgi:diguanylate cyclase (GGDEF)-like protein/PAS domain S-box-containing protein